MSSQTPTQTTSKNVSAGLEPCGELAIRVLAMPADTNPSGDIFGGWVMSQMDIAGGVTAQAFSVGRVATVAVNGFTFHYPVKVGDVVCLYADIVEVGTTSVTIQVEAWVQRQSHQNKTDALERVKLTQGIFIYVALDEQESKRTILNKLS